MRTEVPKVLGVGHDDQGPTDRQQQHFSGSRATKVGHRCHPGEITI